MAMSVQKKLVWFHRGAASFARVRAGTVAEPVYPCPICLDAFPVTAVADGQLTSEHVPPKSLGGRELLLTCRRCNNTSGTKLDADAKTKERVRVALDGRLDRAERVKARIGDLVVNAELVSANGQYSLRVPAQVNSPAAKRTLVKLGKVGASLTVQSVPYADLGAKISWLRSGYLALVAMYGYELALDPAMEIVRRQIIECDERKMVSFTSELPQEYPFKRRTIVKVLEPESHGGWAVLFGRYLLHYPGAGDTTFYERMAERADGSVNMTTCRVEGWPSKPTFGLQQVTAA